MSFFRGYKYINRLLHRPVVSSRSLTDCYPGLSFDQIHIPSGSGCLAHFPAFFRERSQIKWRPWDQVPNVPAKHDQFIQHVSAHPDTPMRELLDPCKQYDVELRKMFVQHPDHPAVKQPNIVPVFAGYEQEVKIRARNLQTEIDAERYSYIMPLKDQDRMPNAAPAIVQSLRDFKTNFSVFFGKLALRPGLFKRGSRWLSCGDFFTRSSGGACWVEACSQTILPRETRAGFGCGSFLTRSHRGAGRGQDQTDRAQHR